MVKFTLRLRKSNEELLLAEIARLQLQNAHLQSRLREQEGVNESLMQENIDLARELHASAPRHMY